jgi:hypothetical protein
MDRARGAQTRSDFCRDAILRRLQLLGIEVLDPQVVISGDAGKGGWRPVYAIRRQTAALNDTDASAGTRRRRSQPKAARRGRRKAN